MNYVILAAGMGTRLHPFTKNYPKCMLQIGYGETVIQRMVRLLKKFDSTAHITVVTGFKRNDVEASINGCNFVYNPFYGVTNSIASLWFARDSLFDNVILINGDIVISEQLTRELTKLVNNDLVLVDSSIKVDGDYNVQVIDDLVVVMSKQLDEYYGEYAGITILTKESALLLKEQVERMIEDECINEWYENALVQMILNSEFKLKYYDISDYEWTEIDSVNHLLHARRIQGKDRIV